MASENSKYYVGGTTVYGPRVHGHQKDRVEIASIAQATQPPGTWADDGIDAIKLLSDSLNVKDTTGKTPSELAGEVANLAARVEVLERERDEFRNMLKKLSNIYVHVFDMHDGGGYMAPGSVSRFEDVNEEASALLAKHAGEPGGAQAEKDVT